MGAFGGRREILERLAPVGEIYQAGTLSGNPLSMTAGIETLKMLQRPGFYRELEEKGRKLAEGLREEAQRAGVAAQVNQVSSMLTSFFTERQVVDYTSAKTSAVPKYAQFFGKMLDRGIQLAPSQFEAAFISSEHQDEDIERIIAAAKFFLEFLRGI